MIWKEPLKILIETIKYIKNQIDDFNKEIDIRLYENAMYSDKKQNGGASIPSIKKLLYVKHKNEFTTLNKYMKMNNNVKPQYIQQYCIPTNMKKDIEINQVCKAQAQIARIVLGMISQKGLPIR